MLLMKNTLDIALQHFGTKASLARALGVSPMTVYQWSKRKIPVERALAIQRVSGGVVKACELRPDVFYQENC